MASISHPGAVLPQITFPVLAKVRTLSKVRRFYGMSPILRNKVSILDTYQL